MNAQRTGKQFGGRLASRKVQSSDVRKYRS